MKHYFTWLRFLKIGVTWQTFGLEDSRQIMDEDIYLPLYFFSFFFMIVFSSTTETCFTKNFWGRHFLLYKLPHPRKKSAFDSHAKTTTRTSCHFWLTAVLFDVVLPVHVDCKEGPEDLTVFHQQVTEPGKGLDRGHTDRGKRTSMLTKHYFLKKGTRHVRPQQDVLYTEKCGVRY